MQNTQKKIEEFLQKINYKDISSSQIKLIRDICGDQTQQPEILLTLVSSRYKENLITPLDGFIYQNLLSLKDTQLNSLIKQYLPEGVVHLKSEKDIDYSELQMLLSQQKFLQADILTHKKLCELASIKNNRSWLYFTETTNLPIEDLHTLDNLWRIYSLNRFGFFIQKQILETCQHDWTKFLIKIKWSVNNNLCRYPNEFIWDLDAPKGHLPLFNQLRGTQALASLLSHPAWSNYI
nr:conserved hypothetical plastid protein [Bangiopsis subsimplex]